MAQVENLFMEPNFKMKIFNLNMKLDVYLWLIQVRTQTVVNFLLPQLKHHGWMVNMSFLEELQKEWNLLKQLKH